MLASTAPFQDSQPPTPKALHRRRAPTNAAAQRGPPARAQALAKQHHDPKRPSRGDWRAHCQHRPHPVRRLHTSARTNCYTPPPTRIHPSLAFTKQLDTPGADYLGACSDGSRCCAALVPLRAANTCSLRNHAARHVALHVNTYTLLSRTGTRAPNATPHHDVAPFQTRVAPRVSDPPQFVGLGSICQPPFVGLGSICQKNSPTERPGLGGAVLF
jgi:hypothetical protein